MKIIEIVVFLLIATSVFFVLTNQEKKDMGWLLNQSKSAYLLMNYSGCNKTGLVVMCGAEVARALSERNITVRPYVFDETCTDPNQNKKSIDECKKELIGLGFIIGCGEKRDEIVGNRVVYVGKEKELRECRIADKIRLS